MAYTEEDPYMRNPVDAGTGQIVRQVEADRLTAAATLAAAGMCVLVDLVGEPGAGKTFLLGHAARTATARGMAVALTRCVPGRSTTRGRALSAAATTGPPRALLIDDAHDVTPTEAEAIAELVATRPDRPQLVVLARRAHGTPPALAAHLAHAAEVGTCERLGLPPLDVEQCAQLLGRSARDPVARRAAREGDGVPLYVLASAAQQVPAGDRDPTARTRLARLRARLAEDVTVSTDPAVAAVAAAGAVLDGPFDVDALAEVADLSERSVQEAVGVLVARDVFRSAGSGPRLCFRHPAVAAAVYESIGTWPRQRAHRRALALTRRRGAAPGVLAAHVAGGLVELDAEHIGLLLRGAAERPAEAVGWLRLVLANAGHLDDAAARELVRLVTEVVGAWPDGPPPPDLLEGLVWHAPRPDRAEAVAFAALRWAVAGRFDTARALVDDHLATHGPDAALAAHRELLAVLEQRVPAAEPVAAAAAAARAAGDHVGTACALALAALGTALSPHADAPAVARAKRAVVDSAARLDALPDAALGGAIGYLGVLGWAELLLGEPLPAVTHLRRGLSLLPATPWRFLLPHFQVGLALGNSVTGLPGEGRRVARQVAGGSAAGPRAAGIAIVELMGTVVPTRVDADAVPAPREPDSTTAVSGSAHPLLSLLTATRLRLLGDGVAASATLLTSGGGPTLGRLPAVLRPCGYELLAATAPPGAADEWARRAVAAAEGLDLHAATAFANFAAGHALAGHDPGPAARRYQAAACLFAHKGMVVAQAWALRHAVSRLADAGSDTAAREVDTVSRALADGAGVRFPDRAGPGTTRAADPLAELTDREHQVADLATTGLRNREIAVELGLSPRTVEVHLSRVYRKLKVSTRVELVRVLATARAR
ncbi:helix-turn-helix transcriptional regulator [Actinokineospora auranticolor]|uniref:Regulatory LuxR family protein n=1 Tax=Actinokineospora auranticolor TaxID=155976 RepID=A0A2S6GLY3_9PSEU|nr:helix-turn-helix transcriptional regulator [Actinokineospora auranticolor]PPK66176.1 regulatory LuxR family protein [Actinokineospora auranticolor]